MMGMDAPQIVAKVKAGPGAGSLFTAHDAAAELSRKHNELAARIQALQSKMAGAWTGNAADQARVGAGPLVQASEVAGQHLAKAQDLYISQGNSFNSLKATVDHNDPGPKPDSTWMSRNIPFLSSRDEEIDTWNQKAQVVVDGYNNYHGESSTNSAQWPRGYGQLGLPPGGAGVVVQQDPGTGARLRQARLRRRQRPRRWSRRSAEPGQRREWWASAACARSRPRRTGSRRSGQPGTGT